MIKKLSKYIGEYKKYLILGPMCVTVEIICEVLMPFLMSKIIDIGVVNKDVNYIYKIGIIMTLLSVLAIIMGSLNIKFSSEASQGFAANLRGGLFDKVKSFSFSNIDKFSTASLVTRLTNDVTQLQMTFMMGMRILVRAPLMMIASLIFAIAINARLAIIIIIAIPILAVGLWFIMKNAESLFTIVQSKIDALNNTVEENLIGIRVVKAFVRMAHEKQKFKKSNDELSESALKAGNLIVMNMPLMMFVSNAAIIAVIWVGGHMVGQKLMGTGELISFISYIMQILMSVMMFSMVIMMATRADASARRITEVLDTTIDISDKTDAKDEHEKSDLSLSNVKADNLERKDLTVKKGKVEFKHVYFKYTASGKGEDVLSDINFTAEPGEFVGIIGSTGSGKSSIVNLIPRLYDASDGQVLVDDTDVRDYHLKDLRDGIGMVLQKNMLFSGTIKENLLWGNENAIQDEIENAAQNAQAYDFIMSFPDGYDTELGQGGVNVSGGQKQRLCIARALLKKPSILIMDDSTSAVDTATEAKIRQSLKSNLKGMTTFIIAQRISSVKEADKIIVLDDGRIVGIGTHEELLADNKVYEEICNSQKEGAVA